MLSDPRPRRILQTPSSAMFRRSPADGQYCVSLQGGTGELALEEEGGESDADVAIPLGESSALDCIRDAPGLEFFDLGEDAVPCPEADYDLWHAEEEGLDPVFHELPVKGKLVVVGHDLGACLELYPVDGLSRSLGLGVPDCVG